MNEFIACLFLATLLIIGSLDNLPSDKLILRLITRLMFIFIFAGMIFLALCSISLGIYLVNMLVN
jgi:hypothetical protein